MIVRPWNVCLRLFAPSELWAFKKICGWVWRPCSGPVPLQFRLLTLAWLAPQFHCRPNCPWSRLGLEVWGPAPGASHRTMTCRAEKIKEILSKQKAIENKKRIEERKECKAMYISSLKRKSKSRRNKRKRSEVRKLTGGPVCLLRE